MDRIIGFAESRWSLMIPLQTSVLLCDLFGELAFPTTEITEELRDNPSITPGFRIEEAELQFAVAPCRQGLLAEAV